MRFKSLACRLEKDIFAISFGFGGSKSKQKSETTTSGKKESKVDRELTDAQKLTKSTTQTGVDQESKNVSILDEESRVLLGDFLQNLVGGVDTGADQINQLAAQIQERALGAEESVNAQTAAIIDEARRSGEEQIGRNVTDLAQATGSSQNTLVGLVGAKGTAELESRLAALGAQFAVEARSTETAELQNSLTALTAGVQAGAVSTQSVAQIADILKGTTITSETQKTSEISGSEITDAVRSLNEIIDSLTTFEEQSKTKGKGSSGSAKIGF